MKYLLLLACNLLFLMSCNSKKNVKLIDKTMSNDKKVIAYVHSLKDNWGENFEKAKQITHINYAFANIKDGEIIIGKHIDVENFKKLNELKKVNPNLKILISVGGWSWSKNFSDAVLTQESREKFANSAVLFVQKHHIDGVDLDWEYPGLPGDGNVYRPEDKENFTAILKLIRAKFDSLETNNRHYFLTIATGSSQNYLDHTNLREAHKFLDFINIMTYDFYGEGSITTGHHANLYPSSSDNSKNIRSAINAVQQHVNAGIPINKIVLGVPFYGRWWKGVMPTNNGLYQEIFGKTGTFNYDAIADSLKNKTGFVESWDESAKTPYIWREKDSLFMTYDNEKSIKYKMDYIKNKDLGGIMFWQFNGDNGALLDAISNNLHSK